MDNSAAYDHGAACSLLGRPDEARQFLERALARGRRSITHYNAACGQPLAGEYEVALDYLGAPSTSASPTGNGSKTRDLTCRCTSTRGSSR
jgi:hypothetical protein